MALRTQLFIDNAWTDAEGGRTFVTVDPATEDRIAEVALASATDVDRAVNSSRRAYRDEWSKMPPEKRGELLNRLADIIDSRKEEIAVLETRDMGKPLRESYGNVARSSRTCRYYAGAVDKLLGDQIPTGHGSLSFTMIEPLGVTAHITPWNYPFANACRSLPAALAAGSTVILKPASDTPLTALLLGELCAEAGFPAGVVNVVPGSGSVAGAALARHVGVQGLTFTGSVSTGKQIAAYAAQRMIPAVLELGGKNPQVIFADADFDLALAQTMRGAFTNAGQVCTSVSRVLVERPIYSRYVDALQAKIDALTIGPGPINPDIGPLVSRAHRDELARFTTIARDYDKARLVAGGQAPPDLPRGYFWRPTLFDEVTADMTIAREEVFGPLLCVMPFETEAEAIAIADGLDLGLTSGVFTRDIGRALRFARDIEAGIVWINEWFLSPVQTPHGGVKDSGLGREQGMQSLMNYARVKSINIRL